MTRALTAAGALAITAVMIAGVAHANPLQQQIAAAQVGQAEAVQPAWHYEWQYHHNKWGQYVPGWIAIPSYAR